MLYSIQVWVWRIRSTIAVKESLTGAGPSMPASKKIFPLSPPIKNMTWFFSSSFIFIMMRYKNFFSLQMSWKLRDDFILRWLYSRIALLLLMTLFWDDYIPMDDYILGWLYSYWWLYSEMSLSWNDFISHYTVFFSFLFFRNNGLTLAMPKTLDNLNKAR